MSSDQGKTIFDEKNYAELFKWPEYCVFASVLVVSMGIGVFYGFFHKKNRTNEEFLMASRSMSVFPVTLSLICSFVSAITIMGTCVEVFYYGIIYIFFAVAFVPMTIAVAYLYLPVFFSLQLTSAYEYFELRFSRRVRLIISISAIVHLLIYMPLTVWAPSLALERVAGINKYISCAAIFIVCIVYSSIGGLKAVLWTDALQAIIMIGSVIVVICVGTNQIGGLSVVWERASKGGRLNIANFDPDPRTRHTIWTGLIAAYFSWIPLFAGAQAQIQRYLAVPTVEKAKQCLFFNMFGLLAVVFLCAFTGLVIFAKYHDCDPFLVNGVTSTDQLLPLFVMDVLGTFSGLPGLMVAGLTCGSLSSVSSALNALPAIIVEDYVKPYRPGLSDVKLGYLSKIISLVGGMISFVLIFVISLIGNVLPFASLLHGTFLGPVCALFSLGMFFPWANAVGSILGVIVSLALTLFIGIGSIIQGNAGKLSYQKLDLRTDGCYLNDTIATTTSSLMQSYRANTVNTDWKDEEFTGLNNLFGISYLWLPAITVIAAIIFGLIFSFMINFWSKSKKPPVKAQYFTPIVLSLWIKIYGKEKLQNWVDFDSELSDSKNPDVKQTTKPAVGLSNISQESDIDKRTTRAKLEDLEITGIDNPSLTNVDFD